MTHVVGPAVTPTRPTLPVHGDGESQRFNLLAVQQVIDHDAAVPPRNMGKTTRFRQFDKPNMVWRSRGNAWNFL